MKVEIIKGPCGVKEALFGLGLSYGKTSGMSFDEFDPETMVEVANKLAHRQGGHNKFLESITLWLDITAPRYWWAEFDTYRVGVTKQSESTMHTIMKRELTQDDFAEPINEEFILFALNVRIYRYNHTEDPVQREEIFREIKGMLPEGFLQRRIVYLNAKTLQNMYHQRKNHKLKEWREFFACINEKDGTLANRWIFGE